MSAEKSGQTASFLFERERGKLQRSFSTMVKVVGPVCNLDCDYCYYLEKSALYPEKKLNLSSFRMKEEMLEKFIRDYIWWRGADIGGIGLFPEDYRFAAEIQ